MNSFFRVGLPADTERLLTLETSEGKESRGGRVELAEAVRDELEGTWALAMLLSARVSICAIACVCSLLQLGAVVWAGGVGLFLSFWVAF